MMTTKKHMISLIMDGIRDTDMIAGYAETAMEEDDKHAAWFAQRARERLAELRRDWDDVERELELKHHKDELTGAMDCHICREVDRVKARVEKL